MAVCALVMDIVDLTIANVAGTALQADIAIDSAGSQWFAQFNEEGENVRL